MKKLLILIVIIIIGITLFFMFKENAPVTVNPLITLKTNKGDITLELFSNQIPITAGNFIKLAKEGFFDGIKFHRVNN